MSPTSHVAASAVVSAVFALYSRSPEGTIACFLSGIFIDLDHFVDYWIAKRKLIFSYPELYAFCANEKTGRLHLFLHSYELHALMWAAVYFGKASFLWQGLAVGMTSHLFLDQIFNPLRPFVYFFIYRLKHGFHKKCIFTEEYYRTLV